MPAPNLIIPSSQRLAVTERLERRTALDPVTGCREWAGVRNSGGYGFMKVAGRMVGVHRIAWELAHGPIPPGLFVCHHCDNRACIATEHFFLGTHTDNMRDASAKGRLSLGQYSRWKVHSADRPVGEKNPRSKLTAPQVAAICRLYTTGRVSQGELATQFGVSRSQIGAITRGTCWRAA